MLYLLRRHPIPIKAFFRHSLVLTYALPEELLGPLLPPGLTLDTYRGHGFVAVAMVQTRSLRPVFLPAWAGQNFFLTGYRIFARYRNHDGRSLRGLKILRSDTDRRAMVVSGNLLTHYNYRHARVRMEESGPRLDISIRTSNAEADLEVGVDLARAVERPPEGSPFEDLHEARKFAGPLPFTFDHERETGSIVIIEGVRENWKPTPVDVDVRRITFFDRPPFNAARPILANAFHIANIDYRWKRGVRQPLAERDA